MSDIEQPSVSAGLGLVGTEKWVTGFRNILAGVPALEIVTKDTKIILWNNICLSKWHMKDNCVNWDKSGKQIYLLVKNKWMLLNQYLFDARFLYILKFIQLCFNIFRGCFVQMFIPLYIIRHEECKKTSKLKLKNIACRRQWVSWRVRFKCHLSSVTWPPELN